MTDMVVLISPKFRVTLKSKRNIKFMCIKNILSFEIYWNFMYLNRIILIAIINLAPTHEECLQAIYYAGPSPIGL